MKTVILTLFPEAVEIEYHGDCLDADNEENSDNNLISRNINDLILAMVNALGNAAVYNTPPFVLSITKHLGEIIANNSSTINLFYTVCCIINLTKLFKFVLENYST